MSTTTNGPTMVGIDLAHIVENADIIRKIYFTMMKANHEAMVAPATSADKWDAITERNESREAMVEYLNRTIQMLQETKDSVENFWD